jgi:hypothetical protein
MYCLFCVVLCIVCFVLFYVLFVLCCSLYCLFCVVLCIVCFVLFSVLFVCICVLNYCHRVATQLQLNISYHISYHIIKETYAHGCFFGSNNEMCTSGTNRNAFFSFSSRVLKVSYYAICHTNAPSTKTDVRHSDCTVHQSRNKFTYV